MSQKPFVCHGHSRPIVEVNYSHVTPDGYFLTSASKDGQPMLRRGDTGDWMGTFLGHKGAVWSCVLDTPALTAATASADFSAKVWDALTGLEKHTFQHKHIVRTLAYSPSSVYLATGGHEKVLRVFDLNRPDAAPLEVGTTTAPLRNSAYLTETTMLTTCSDQPGASIWDVRSCQVVRTLPTDEAVSSIDLTFDGSVLTTTDGRNIRMWDTARLAPLHTITSQYPVEAASYCPQLKRIAAGGADMWVRLHDAETGAELECNRGHHGPVHTVRFGPEGKEYASGSEDGTIRIWQTQWQAGEASGAAKGLAEQPSPSVAANGTGILAQA